MSGFCPPQVDGITRSMRNSADRPAGTRAVPSAVLAAVEAKLEGQEVAPRCAQPEEPILDLVEALQRSLARKPAKTRRRKAAAR